MKTIPLIRLSLKIDLVALKIMPWKQQKHTKNPLLMSTNPIPHPNLIAKEVDLL
jgi:hypothetical protein